MDTKKIISVSDINSWLYCPRKVYLNKICGLQISQNRNMVIGRLKHTILENFSRSEEKLISRLDENFDSIDLVFVYEDLIKNTAKNVFNQNQPSIEKFLIDKEDILKKIMRDFAEDIKLRVKSIKESLAKGFTKENIWKNMDSIYLSELKLESEALGLKGRVDRVIISRKDNSIIPFELKSREERIFLSDELQLTAYAMLLEHQYHQKIPKGIVEVGNNRQEIEISEDKKREVLKIAEEIRNLKEGLIPPIQSNFNKCKSCEFREECMKLGA
jgi:CRISPR-associated protein Cas4